MVSKSLEFKNVRIKSQNIKLLIITYVKTNTQIYNYNYFCKDEKVSNVHVLEGHIKKICFVYFAYNNDIICPKIFQNNCFLCTNYFRTKTWGLKGQLCGKTTSYLQWRHSITFYVMKQWLICAQVTFVPNGNCVLYKRPYQRLYLTIL